jgi:RNase P/RNase MRP subunit POP5
MITKRKSRYILVEPSSTEARQIFTMLEAELLRILGQITYTNASPKVVAQYGRLFAVRVNRGFEKNAVLALSFAHVQGIGFRTIKISGTLKTLKECAKQYSLEPDKH